MRSNHYYTGKAVKETPFRLRAQLNVASMHLTTSSDFTLLREAEKVLPVRAGMNEGILRSLGEGGYASEGWACRRAVEGAPAVKPWGSTKMRSGAEVSKTNEKS